MAHIPDITTHDVERRTTSSSGPGGQHANKSETRVFLRLDIDAHPAFSDRQKMLLKERISKHLIEGHILEVSSQKTRSQSANEKDALAKLNTIIQRALRPRAMRKTETPRAARRKKKRISRDIKESRKRKRARRKPPSLED